MRSLSLTPGLALLKAIIQVRQHTRKDGTLVRAHTRNVQTRGERRELVEKMARRMADGEHVRHASLGSALGAARHASRANGKAAHVYEHADGGWVSTHDETHTQGHAERIVAVKGKARLHRAGKASRSLAHLKGPIMEHHEKPARAPKAKQPKQPAPVSGAAAPALDEAAMRKRDAVLPGERLSYAGAPTVEVHSDPNGNNSIVLKFQGGEPTDGTLEALKARGFGKSRPGEWYAANNPTTLRLANYTRRRYNGLTPEERAQREAWATLTPAEHFDIAHEPLPALGGVKVHDNRAVGLLARAQHLNIPVPPDAAQAVRAYNLGALVALHAQVHAAEAARGEAEKINNNFVDSSTHPMALLATAAHLGVEVSPAEVQQVLAGYVNQHSDLKGAVARASKSAWRTGVLREAGLLSNARNLAEYTTTINLRGPDGSVRQVPHTFKPGQTVLADTSDGWTKKLYADLGRETQKEPMTLVGIVGQPGGSPVVHVLDGQGHLLRLPISEIAQAPTYEAPPAMGDAGGPKLLPEYVGHIAVYRPGGPGGPKREQVQHAFKPGQRVEYPDGEDYRPPPGARRLLGEERRWMQKPRSGILLHIFQGDADAEPMVQVLADNEDRIKTIPASHLEDGVKMNLTYNRLPEVPEELRKAMSPAPSSRLLFARW